MVRLYHSIPFTEGTVQLSTDQHHYIAHVLRFKVGETLYLFNEHVGEWQGMLTVLSKKEALVQLIQCIRQPTVTLPVHLIFAPLKNDATQYLLEKATELGATDLWPVVTERTVNRWNAPRAQVQVVMATQQCERLDPPHIHSLQKLPNFLKNWDKPLLVAVERKESPTLKTTLEPVHEPAFLIGPEGGFSSTELELLLHQSFVSPFTLGHRILRAETAALACLAAWSYHKGE